MPVTSKINISPVVEEKSTLVSEEPQIYASKIVSLESGRVLCVADQVFSVYTGV